MTLVKWNPFEALTDMQEDIDRLFARRLSPTKSANRSPEAELFAPVDIHEDKESLYFDVELPGLKQEHIDVSVEDKILTIKGKKERIQEQKEKNYHRIEREYGHFSRSFSLPETADTSKVQAEYKNGILHVRIAKKEAALPKKIDVKVAA